MSFAKRLRLAQLPLACALLLTACAQPAPQVVTVNEIQRVVLRPPAPLLECLPDPEPPADADLARIDVPGLWDGLVSHYVLALWASGADCRHRLGEVKRWAEKEE